MSVVRSPRFDPNSLAQRTFADRRAFAQMLESQYEGLNLAMMDIGVAVTATHMRCRIPCPVDAENFYLQCTYDRGAESLQTRRRHRLAASQRCLEHSSTRRVQRALWVFLMWPLHC